MIYADQRWIGDHGIGRFARHVLAGLDCRPISLESHPAAALDSLRLSYALRHSTPNDLFFSPGYNSPLYSRAPFIFAIHDLSHVYCPVNSSSLIRLYYSTILKNACYRSARIVTVSEFTRSQIVEWSGVPVDKVVNVGCGVDPSYRPGEGPPPFAYPYLLCVSNRKNHKNEFRTVEAFAKSGLDKDFQLVLTGKPTDGIKKLVKQRGLSQRVVFAGTVAEREMPALYGGAAALVFASLYEGFGLPLLEAMACGLPVITSNVTALPEIAGGAALLVDPTSIDQIANAMNSIVSDSSLREQLRTRGLARAADFSWERTTGAVRSCITGYVG